MIATTHPLEEAFQRAYSRSAIAKATNQSSSADL